MPADGYSAEARPEGVPADAELEADLELVLIRKVCTALDASAIVACMLSHRLSPFLLNLRHMGTTINKTLR